MLVEAHDPYHRGHSGARQPNPNRRAGRGRRRSAAERAGQAAGPVAEQLVVVFDRFFRIETQEARVRANETADVDGRADRPPILILDALQINRPNVDLLRDIRKREMARFASRANPIPQGRHAFELASLFGYPCARMSKTRVVAAMSGGVDSAVAAGLLLGRGYQRVGVTMTMYVATRPPHAQSCCG